MESIARRIANPQSLDCLSRFHHPSSKLLQCRFLSGTPNPTARSIPKANRPQSSAAALLSLDKPESSPGLQAAIQESRQRYQNITQSKEDKRAKELRQQGMERLLYRKWQEGDLYTPHDLTPREIVKFNKTKAPTKDVFDVLGLNPIDAYKNPVLLAEFMTTGGKIKHPSLTGLRPVNQRKLAKTIRRAIGMGIMPSCHVHPEMLRRSGPDANSRQYKWK